MPLPEVTPQQYNASITAIKGLQPLIVSIFGAGAGAGLASLPLPDTLDGFRQQWPIIAVALANILWQVGKNLWKNHPKLNKTKSPTP